MNIPAKCLSGISMLLLLTSPASALEYKLAQPEQSVVTFGFTLMGAPLEGTFRKFATELYFDPAKLAKAQARIEVNVASIDTGSNEGNEEVVGKKWFNAKDYPTATFVSTGLKALGGNRYQATGKLSIKGKTLDVAAPVTFQSEGTRGTFDGTFSIKRLDYMIGEGEWTDVSSVANEVQIKFHVVVNASPARK
ncbi:YceI family protein [Sideroxydans lithotrophicus]|uniref:YceI family protein n=1 Tax=Sideroxydans lithotrophicus (strain ES-1) TaxID=580332 RepID=D5CRK0_SIDLE|nr:YceI family protein [Sideroxydans lithotrophicus]ADE11586.1 YceI family protein [Sideroxydans lithotrophicus ES-1]